MAHVLINGGTAAGGASPTESIWEVAVGLSSELLECMDELQTTVTTPEELARLSSGEEGELGDTNGEEG